MHYCLDSRGFIVQFKSHIEVVSKGVMDIKNWRIMKAKFKDNSGDYIYGINLMGRKDNQDFYSFQEDDIEEWFRSLVPFWVLLDLNKSYERMNKIGEGSFAKVYKYKRKSDGKLFAVKSLEKKRYMDQIRERGTNFLIGEIEILRTWDHPHIIKLHEVYEDNTHVHLVLDMLEGGELLKKIWNKVTYTEADAIKIMQNILSAISYLHKKGIIHRDLKPENLILARNDDDYDIKIADFGLATLVKPGEKLTLPWGSPGYVAYELLKEPSPGYDTKADIFSVGAILYLLLTGKSAFRGANQEIILEKNTEGDPGYPLRFWNKISKNGWNLVKKLLEKHPDKRVSAEEAINDPWFTDQVEDHDLGDVIEGIKEIQENKSEYSSKNNSKRFLTTTPVMAGRHVKDTCESPWMPSGMTPEMDPSTPLLRYGFDLHQKRNFEIAEAKIMKRKNSNEDSNENRQEAEEESDPIKRFNMIQARRNKKSIHQETMKFGGKIDIGSDKNEELKIDPITRQAISPNNDLLFPKTVDKTPDTKSNGSIKKLVMSESKVNLKDEDIWECSLIPEDPSLNHSKYKSFRPGNPYEERIIPMTPGEKHASMNDKNKPMIKAHHVLSKYI
jgi:serine/threonine protein kinase